jgi:hypothetical protein
VSRFVLRGADIVTPDRVVTNGALVVKPGGTALPSSPTVLVHTPAELVSEGLADGPSPPSLGTEA